MPTNPQPQPDAVTDAETRVLAYLDKVQSFVKHDYACELLDEPGYFATLDYGDLRALLALLATLRGERDALLADKARLDILQDWLRGADYAYGELGEDQVLVFDLPAIRVSCDLRKTLDDARAPQGRTE
jgi:hypothetical protein